MSSLTSRNNLIGIAALVIGIFVFSTQDTIIKSISGTHAVTLAIFLRSIVSFPILLVLVAYEGGLSTILTPHWKLLLTRGLILFLAYISYYTALAAMPMAEVTALFSVAPIMVTMMSGPILGEKVSRLAWVAVVIGLIGSLLIVRPGTSIFNPAALLPLASAATYAYAMILARKHAANVPTAVMSFYQNMTYLISAPVLGYLLGAGVIGSATAHPSLGFLLRPWAWPNTHDMLLMMACGIIAAIAATLLTHAYRKGEASVVTPFEYTSMFWGTIWGLLLFSEIPKPVTLVGMALIATAGILALRAGKRAA
jgi:drug/metabolite transporter (DMT)-like permease